MKISNNYPDQRNCAHAWAHQITNEGFSSNFFFDGNTIYSYGRHFPIAVLDGNRVFFTTDTYSRTTAKHVAIVRSAISHLQIIYVHYLPTARESSDPYFINMNLDHWIENLESLLASYDENKRRSSLLREIESVRCRIDSFLKQLAIKPSKKLSMILTSPSAASINNYYKIARQKARANEKARLASERKLFNTDLAQWRIGKIKNLIRINPDDSSLAFLRISESNLHIETSKGIRVQIDIAKCFYTYIVETLNGNHLNVDYTILSYEVKTISFDSVVIGCHKIPISEIRSMASRLNW